MRNILLGLVLGVLVAGSAFAQSPQLIFQAEVQTLPELKLELKDVISILVDYKIEHTNMAMFCQHFYGATAFDNRTVELCDLYDTPDRRLTVLHELLHIRYKQELIETGGPYEAQIDALAHKLYAQLYGELPKPQPTNPPSPAPVVPETPTSTK